jgi:hypothetical protein
MTEDFIQFIWRTKNFNFHHLRSTGGAVVEILDFGQWNTGSGPDFSMARVRIDNTTWAGNIEMHLSASDWHRHGHSDDPAYANVILHVVLEEDKPAYSGSRRIPCIELQDRINNDLLGQYMRLMANALWVPCAAHLPRVKPITRDAWLDRMLMERLELKASRIFDILQETHNDWEVALYRSLAFNRSGGLTPGWKSSSSTRRPRMTLWQLHAISRKLMRESRFSAEPGEAARLRPSIWHATIRMPKYSC